MLRSRLHWLVLAGALVLYAAFATRTYYWDGVLFSLNIEAAARGEASVASLFHPNHLIYTAFGYWLYRAALACGLAVRALTILRAANIFLSVAAATVFYAIAKRVTQSAELALGGLSLFSFGAIWWKFSTDADPYIAVVLLVLLAIWFLLQDRPRWWAAGTCHVAAMLFHELAVFAYAPILMMIWLRAGAQRTKKAAVYAVVTAACVGAAYELCFATADHGAHPSLIGWVTSYASDSGFTRSFVALFDPYLTSYLKLFAGGRFSLMRETFSPVSCLGYLLCAAGLGVSIALFRRVRAQAGVSLEKRLRVVFWVWLIAFAVFFALWDPGSTFHKLFVWPAMILLIVLYAAPQRAQALFWLAVALAGWNFAAFIYPHSRSDTDPVLSLAQKIDHELPRNVTIYYSAFSPDDWYLDYFAPYRNWVKLTNPNELAPSTSLVCFDKTALDAFQPGPLDGPKWDLMNRQHNIRLECRKPQLSVFKPLR